MNAFPRIDVFLLKNDGFLSLLHVMQGHDNVIIDLKLDK